VSALELAPSVLDMFSGCGGLSTGLAAVGFHIRGGVDSDKDAMETFRNAHPGGTAWCMDARLFVDNLPDLIPDYRQIDILVGGPPCQGFCVINPTRSAADPRNTCVQIFLDAAELIRPQVVVMENVPGLITLADGVAFHTVTRTLESLHYQVSSMVLQAAHYGVPQSRWRLFIVATRSDCRFAFPSPTHRARITPNVAGGRAMTMQVPDKDDLFTTMSRPTTVRDAISDLPPLRNGGGKPTAAYRKASTSTYQALLRGQVLELRNHQAARLGDAYMNRIRAIPDEGMCWLDLPEDLIPANIKRSQTKWKCRTATRFGRLRWDGLFSTILTRPEPYWGAFIHPTQHRVLSVREFARAQSFPDAVSFAGDLDAQYRQVGNAIPPIVGQVLGRELLAQQAFIRKASRG